LPLAGKSGICAAGAATAIAACLLASPSALAQSEGGAVYLERPKVTKVECLRACASRDRAQPGSTLRVRGKALSGVDAMIFHGANGRGDDARAKVRAGSGTRLNVKVPAGASTGPVSVQTEDDQSSARTKPVAILPAPPPEPNPDLTPVPGLRQAGAPRLETGTSRTKAYVGARRAVTFSYRVSDGQPARVRVELVRASDASVVRTWTPTTAEGAVQTLSWNGKVGRGQAPRGRYSFRLTVDAADGARAQSSQVGDSTRDAFDLYDHVFPIRGRHDYGGAGARFGTGRAGHSHQGQDIFARCGTRMVAARGGLVKFSGYHAAAGNYMVIDGGTSGFDYAYMHMTAPSPFRKGDRVYTGQEIGTVGESGNARGCHLHYELWGDPGWYTGGRPVDPFPALRAWDSWS